MTKACSSLQSTDKRLASYREELAHLDLSRTLANNSDLKWGTPRTIFVCISHTSTDGTPLHIITTSNDSWGTVKPVNDWCKQTRRARFQQAECEGDTGFEDRTIQFYDRVKREKEAWRARNGQRPKAAIIVQLRLDAIKNVKESQAFFDHRSEIGTAFTFPGGEYLARCFKCRAFFKYKVPRETRSLEKDGASLITDAHYPADSCAEVLAHCFCSRQNSTA